MISIISDRSDSTEVASTQRRKIHALEFCAGFSLHLPPSATVRYGTENGADGDGRAKAMTVDWDAMVRKQPALAAVPDGLRAGVRLRPFVAGETLYKRGTRPRAMLCVLAGEIRLVRHSPGGAVITLQRARAGFIAEASLESNAYHCDVVAAADGRLLEFGIPEFRAALENDAAFRRAWMGQLSREVRKLRAQCERLSLNGAAERILHYIESDGVDGVVVLAQSRKAWAAELGLTHEVLYRTLRRLRDDGTLLLDGDRIAIARW